MRRVLGGPLFGLAMSVSMAAVAQDYPTRSVTILCPFAPGGGTDQISRAVAQKLEQRLGKPFLVENRTGAGTLIAAAATAKAAPDGYTLMQATSGTMSMNQTIFKHLSYEPLKDLVPVALIAGVPFVLVVHPDLPVHGLADLIKLGKEKPLRYGSGGVSAFHHLNAELFTTMAGIQKMTHVPNRGSVPAMTDLIQGSTDMLFVDIGPSIQLIRAGKARALGITSAELAEAAPEIPPIAKALPGFDTTAWQMMVAPGGTPRPVLEKLNSEINALVQSEDIKKRFVPMGIVPIGKGSLTDLDAYVKSETTRWAAVIKNAGLAGSQ
jgi:tripartite-type tricarboxylate transporter receptor subunit TctC